MMKRREFLIGSTLGAGAAWAQGVKAWAQSPEKAKRDRMAVMTLAFDSMLKDPAYPDDPKRTLDFLDMPDLIASHYGIHHVEVQHTHFVSTELPYLREFRDRVMKANSYMNQICLEFESLNISSPDPILRVETIDLTKQWIDHAVELGCPRVMVNQGTLAPEVRQSAIETLKTIGKYGKSRKVFVTMENRGGHRHSTPPASSSTGPETAEWGVLVEVIKAAGIYANPDIGNFPDEQARAAGLRAMYPLSSGSSHVHYNPAKYNEANAIKISKEVGYKGLYSIEASTINGPDPYSRVQTILDELLRDL